MDAATSVTTPPPDISSTFRSRSLVADVQDAETQYHAHEFLDATVQPKPIYISPNEVYAMHGLLSKYQEKLVGIYFAKYLVALTVSPPIVFHPRRRPPSHSARVEWRA